MSNLTPEGFSAVRQIAERNGVSVDAALALLDALGRGNGSQAQFNHPDLGGMGQWSQGGMIMVGDMFNQGLKHRIDSLCNELAGLLRNQPFSQGGYSSQSQGGFSSQSLGGGASLFVAGSGSSSNGWPAELGVPASSGAQNDLRYAFFPAARRLAIQQGGATRVYDTGEHNISGYSQQQGGDQSLTFTSQFGLVRVADLPLVGPAQEAPAPHDPSPAVFKPAGTPSYDSRPAATPSVPASDILKTIEALADLRKKDILTEQEFAAKKADLLSRL